MWQVTQLVLFQPSTNECVRFNFFPVVVNSGFNFDNNNNLVFVTVKTVLQ